MSKKRLIASLAAVVLLLAVAGVLEVLLLVFPAAPETPSEPSVSTASVVEKTASSSSEASEKRAEPAQSEQKQPSAGEKRAAELVRSGAIVIDGTPLQRDQAESLVADAKPYTSKVSNVDQNEVLPSGCEIVALSVALQAEGFDASPEDIARRHLRLGADYAADYVGDPWSDGCGLPPCIVDAGNSLLSEQGSSAHVADLTGTTFEGVVGLVELGYPVIAWATEGLTEPSFVMTWGTLGWYLPEHCIVVYGVEGDKVLVSDSLEGLAKYDRDEFAHIYEACGNLAVFVIPAQSNSPDLR